MVTFGFEVRDIVLMCGFGVTLLTIYYNIVKTQTLKSNDLHHLALDTKEIKESLNKASDERAAHSKALVDLSERISKLEGSVSLCQSMNGKNISKRN